MNKFALSLVALAGASLVLQGCSDAVAFQDGGPGDSGPMIDAGSDAGPDAGPDAGFDGGPDSGPDAGPDAGPPPPFGTPILSSLPFGAGDMAVADFNGDGKQDLVVSLDFPYFGGASVEVLLGNGDGTFQAPQDLPTAGTPRGVAVLDIDGDGRPDFAVGSCGDGGSTLAFFLNGDGGFGPHVDVPVSSCPISLAVADLNGDGLPDVAAAGPGAFFGAGADGGLGEVNLLMNLGGGTFAVGQTLTLTAPVYGITTADFNGDRIPDLVVTTNSYPADGGIDAELQVWLGADGGAMQALPPLNLDHGTFGALAAGDLDADGHQDLAIVSSDGNGLALLLGNGDGTFQTPTYHAASGNPVAVALGDLAHDGTLGAATASSNAYFQGLSIFPGGREAPAPPLGAQTRLLTDGASYGLAIADFNGDGRMDIAVSLTYRNAIAVLPGLRLPPLLQDPATFRIAPHTAIPNVPYQGGPIIGSPQMITLTFQDDPNIALFEQYADWIVTSQWLTTVGTPYGIGLGSNTNLVLPQNAPTTIQDSEIQTLIFDLISDGGVPPPVVPSGGIIPQQIYFVYFPYSTTVDAAMTGKSCANFGGYHGEMDGGALHFAYAVIPTCNPYSPYPQESAVSHELAEAATDPLVETHPAYTSGAKSLNGGLIGEAGDVCTQYESFWELDGGTVVEAQRIWSNPSAIANSQPCVPLPGGVYANLSPGQTGSVAENTFGVAAGGSIDIPLTAWTNAPSVPFGIVPLPYAKYALIGTNMYPDVSASKWNMANGEQATLTVKVPSNANSGDFGMITLLSGFDEENYGYWPLIIFVP